MLDARFGSPDRPLKIGKVEIPCYVLENGKRVIVQRGLYLALDMQQGGVRAEKYKEYGGAARLVRFLDQNGLKSLISSDIEALLKDPIVFSVNKTPHFGYEATILQEIVRSIAKAYLKGLLPVRHESIGANAEIMDDAFAKVGIIALIDEATGYQTQRVADELEKIFNELLLEKAKRYEVTFPLDLYKQMFRLNNWEWKPENAQKRPGVIGRWTNDLIYDRMAPGLLNELERRNPKNDKGYRDHKHFQFLTNEIGEPKLREYFGGLLALARANTTWRKFYEMVEKAFPKPPDVGDQLKLNL